MSVLLDKLLLRVPERIKEEFAQSRKETNLKNHLVIGTFVLLIQIIFLTLNAFEPFSEDARIMRGYFSFYIVMLALNALMLTLLFLLRKHILATGRHYSFLLIAAIFINHFWSMGIAIADQFQGQEIVVYYLSIYVIAILFDIALHEYLVLVLFTYGVLIILLKLYVASYVGDISEIIAAAIQHILFASIIRYYIGELRRKNFIQQKELEFYSYYDSLSQLYNRRKWEEMYHKAYENAFRLGRMFTVILIDIDYFKQYNDTYGHVAGDDVIRKTSAVLSDVFSREEAFIGRYGGDEFVIYLFDTAEELISEDIEEVKKKIALLNIENKKSALGGKLSITLGQNTAIPQDLSGSWDFVVKADEALYEAKRNRGK